MTGRYDIDRIAVALDIEMGQIGGHQLGDTPSGVIGLALALGVSASTVKRLRRRGMPWHQADQYAVAVGFHPVQLWPSWVADALEDPPSPALEPSAPRVGVCGRPVVGRGGRMVAVAA